MLAKIWVILTMGGSSSDTTALSLLPSRSHRGGMPRSSVLVGAGGSVCFGGQAVAYCGCSQEERRGCGGAAVELNLRYSHRSLQGSRSRREKGKVPNVGGCQLSAYPRCPAILGSVNFRTSSPFHPLPSPPQPQAERSV